MTAEEKNITAEVISRLEIRKKQVWRDRNPYYQNPLFEKSEIESKINQLKKLLK